jgi:Tfp pilus assembly protein PilN
MRIRDKIITAACLTPDRLEWTSLRIRPEGNETVEQSSLPFVVTETDMAELQLSEEMREKFEGDLNVAIRTRELLMRTMEFPTSDPAEITSMAGFQIDKFSPFPIDQLAISHEILRETENGALVLMVGVKHEWIDEIGDLFASKGVHIHSIDARILGWLRLLDKGGHLTGDACELLVINDGLDYVLVILNQNAPIAFRSLPAPKDDQGMAEDLAQEISYTLTTLDTEYSLPAPAAIHFWNHADLSDSMVSTLQATTGLEIRQNKLSSLPPLSEGIIDRTLNRKSRIELIPREWVEHQKKVRMKRMFLISASVIGAAWLSIMLLLTVVYQTRALSLKKVQRKEASLAPVANQAIQNRQKLKALKGYADRSDSALECLREVTRLLPEGDIEFVSFSYNEDKGVSLRGTAESQEIVYQYNDALADSPLFTQLKDERISTQAKGGVERAVFSVNLTIPSPEDER